MNQTATEAPEIPLTSAELAARLNRSPLTITRWAVHGVAGRVLKSKWVGATRNFLWSDYEAWQALVDEDRKRDREQSRADRQNHQPPADPAA